MGPVVLDTSVVIAATDPADAHHSEAAEEIALRRQARQQIRLSAISIAELHALKGPGRKVRLHHVNRFIDALGANAVVEVNRSIAELAGASRASRPSLKIADALIKATADQIGGELLTADRRLAKFDGVALLGAKR